MARRAALQIALLACSLLFSLLPSSVAVDCPALTTDAPAGGQDLADCSCVGGYSGETRCDGNPPRSPLPPPGSKGGRADNGMSCDSPHATLALPRRTCWVRARQNLDQMRPPTLCALGSRSLGAPLPGFDA
jgi:hypothetical protein